MIDGGLFGTPAIGGIYGILVLMYNNEILEGISDYLTKKDKRTIIKSQLKEEWANIKSIFNRKIKENGKSAHNYLKLLIPHIALILIIILRFSIAFYGANTECYELIIDNVHDIDGLNQYDALNLTEHEEKTTVYLSNEL